MDDADFSVGATARKLRKLESEVERLLEALAICAKRAGKRASLVVDLEEEIKDVRAVMESFCTENERLRAERDAAREELKVANDMLDEADSAAEPLLLRAEAAEDCIIGLEVEIERLREALERKEGGE
jgi:chromosome segregation ATPase